MASFRSSSPKTRFPILAVPAKLGILRSSCVTWPDLAPILNFPARPGPPKLPRLALARSSLGMALPGSESRLAGRSISELTIPLVPDYSQVGDGSWGLSHPRLPELGTDFGEQSLSQLEKLGGGWWIPDSKTV